LHKTKLSVLSWEAKNKGSYYKILTLTYMQPSEESMHVLLGRYNFGEVQR